MISSVGRVLTNSGITKRKVIFDDNLSNFFSLQTIEFILNQPDVVGIRAFIASRNNERLVVLVGFNEKLQDIRTAFTSSSMNNAMVQKQTGINTLENNLFAKHISFKLATTFILQYRRIMQTPFGLLCLAKAMCMMFSNNLVLWAYVFS